MTNIIKRIGMGVAFFSILFITSSVSAQAAAPAWDISGTWGVSWDVLGTTYTQNITLHQDSNGNVTGDGMHPTGGAWHIISGSVSGNTLTISATYTTGTGTSSQSTVISGIGTIETDGTMSGTWRDTVADGKSGTWKSVSGKASPLAVVPSDEEFWHGYLFETELTAAEEVTPATPALATAHAGTWFANEGTAMNYWLSVFSEEPVVDAHFHCGAVGENGPAVVNLINKPIDSTGQWYGEIGRKYLTHEDILATGADCESVIGYPIYSVPDLARAIITGDIYVNIHTATYPQGAARGQLTAYPGWND